MLRRPCCVFSISRIGTLKGLMLEVGFPSIACAASSRPFDVSVTSRRWSRISAGRRWSLASTISLQFSPLRSRQTWKSKWSSWTADFLIGLTLLHWLTNKLGPSKPVVSVRSWGLQTIQGVGPALFAVWELQVLGSWNPDCHSLLPCVCMLGSSKCS